MGAEPSFPAIASGMKQNVGDMKRDLEGRLDEFNTLRDEMLYYMTMDRLVASMGEEAPLAVLQDVANHESAHETANALAQAVAHHKGAVDSVCDGARDAAGAHGEVARLRAEAEAAEEAAAQELERAGLSRSLGVSDADSALQALEQEAAAAESRAESLVHTRDMLARRQEELGSAVGDAKAQAEAEEAEAAKWQQQAEMAAREEEQRVAAAEQQLGAVQGQQARADAIAALVRAFTGCAVESAEEDQLVLSLRPDVSGVDGATQAAADPVRLVMLLGPGPDAGQRRVVSFHTEPDTLPVADLLEAVRGGRHTELGLASDQLRVVPEGAPWVVRHVAARAARHASLAREVEVVGKRIPGALVHADENDSAVNATLPCGAVAAVSVDPSYPGAQQGVRLSELAPAGYADPAKLRRVKREVSVRGYPTVLAALDAVRTRLG